MKTIPLFLAALALAGCSRAPEETEAVEPVVQIETAPIKRQTLSETTTIYGNVVAEPGKLHVISSPYETQVRHVLVSPGQPVKKDDGLLEVNASTATELLVKQARLGLESANKELQQTKERFDLKLATNQDLNQAQKAAADAELQLNNLNAAGAGTDNVIRATAEGVAATISAQDGQVIPAGTSFMEIVSSDEIEVKFGVESGDAAILQPGDVVTITAVNQPETDPVEGNVRLVTRRINPATRLVDVYVSLPAGSGLLLDAFVRGELKKTVKDALTVPATAVLPDAEESTVFTVKDGHAIRHVVTVGVQTEKEVQISGDELAEGEAVIITGNYGLEDGAAVEVTK